MGVLAQRREANQLLNKVQIVFRKHADMDHAVFQQIIAMPAGMAENILPLMGLQIHQQGEKSPHQSAEILSHHSASVLVNGKGIFPITFRNRDPGFPDCEQEFLTGQKFHGGFPKGKTFQEGFDCIRVHLMVGNCHYGILKLIKPIQ